MQRTDLWRSLVHVGTWGALASLALTLDNTRRIRRPDPRAVPAPEPLTVLVPMRNESANVVACLTAISAAVARWPGPARVVVIDDESTDGTGAALAALAAADPRIEVHGGRPTPAGWLGKPWACHQLAEHATSTGILAFVDADVRVAPQAFVASAAVLRESGLDLLSPYPRQQVDGLVERLVQPLLQWSFMSTLPLGPAETSARPSLAAANGQLLLVDADAYRRAGGHAAVRAEVLEDIALLRTLKRSGGRGVVAEGSDVATCRMYDGWREVRAGYRKSLWSAFGSLPGTVAVTALLNIVYVLPALAALRGSRIGLLGYVAGVASRGVVARQTGGRCWPDVLAHPASIIAFSVLTADSVVARQRGSLRWKGRALEVHA